MSSNADLEEGEIEEEMTRVDSDSRFDPNFNLNSIETNQTFDRHLPQNKVNQISPIFRSSLKSKAGDSLFGSRDIDLRVGENHFNDCDLRSFNHPIKPINKSINDFNRSAQPFVQKDFQEVNNSIETNNTSHYSVRHKPFNSNNFNTIAKPHDCIPFLNEPQNMLTIQMSSGLRPNKEVLPIPVFSHREPIEPSLQQVCHPMRPRFDFTNISHQNYEPIKQNMYKSESTSSPFVQDWVHIPSDSINLINSTTNQTFLPFNSANIALNNQTFSQTDYKNVNYVSPSERNSELTEERNRINCNEDFIQTIVLSSDEIEEVQMVDACAVNGSQSPYDPEQEITYTPLSPPLISSIDSLLTQPIEIPNEPKSSETVSESKIHTKTDDKKFKSNKRERRISGNEERRERLNRLLKSNSVCDKISNRSSQKRNLNKLRNDKSVDSKSVRYVSNTSNSRSRTPSKNRSHRMTVHRDSCRKSKTRRDFKRERKRKTITLNDQSFSQRNDSRVKSKDLQDVSYEDLLQEVKRIQSQLKDLEHEEQTDDVIIISDSDDRDVIEVIENVNESSEMNRINELKGDTILSGDEDVLELRRLALESKKPRAQPNSRVDTPVIIEIESFDHSVESADYEELDENLLREQLLKSLLSSKSKTEPIKKVDNETTVEEIELNPIISTEIVENLKESETVQYSDIKVDKIPGITVLNPQLIINFGDDSTDDELEKPQIDTVPTLPKGLELFLRQARNNIEPNPHAIHPKQVLGKKTTIVTKFSETQQKEYQKLKAEIARREQYQINEDVLKQNELKWKSVKDMLQEKQSLIKGLKDQIDLKRGALKKAQLHTRKMQEAFIAATRVVSRTAADLRCLNEDLKTKETECSFQTNSVNQIEKQCIRIGLKLKGNTYKLPIAATVKRTIGETNTPRKRTKSEANQLSKQEIADEKKRLQELERIYNQRLHDLKKATLLRPTSPKTIAPKSPQSVDVLQLKSDCNKSSQLSKFQNSQKTLKTIVKQFLHIKQNNCLISLDSFVESMFFDKIIISPNSIITFTNMEYKTSLTVDSEPSIQSPDSVLYHLQSYRFSEIHSKQISSDDWTNSLNPYENMCRYDLLGTCNDEKCVWQHINQSLLDPPNKLVDLLLYDPNLADISVQDFDNIDAKDLEIIRKKLFEFSKKFIESKPCSTIEGICREIVNQIRKRSTETLACIMSRRIPKTINTYKMEVPFDDLCYRFKIRDKSLVLNQAKVSQLRLSADPDIYFHNRFYAPEGVPISAQLETSLASDPHNIQLWLKLAYYHITKCSNDSFAYSIDKALNVLSRALELNKTEPELYEHYLFIYSNRVVRDGEDSKLELLNVCKQVVKHCPHYRVWKCYLSLVTSFEDKILVSAQLLNNLVNNIIIVNDSETQSQQLLEILFYKIHLNLQFNNNDISVKELNTALDKLFLSEAESISMKQDFDIIYISEKLTVSDRVFAWLCLIHLFIYHCLPAHCFELHKQGFPQLINKSHFIFDWNSLIDIIDSQAIRKYFDRAIEVCVEVNQNKPIVGKSNLALYINLAELNRYHLTSSTHDIYGDLMKLTQNDDCLWPSIVKHRFKSDENHAKIIQSLKQSQLYLNKEIKICFEVLIQTYESSDFVSAQNEILTIASKYYNCQLSFPILKLAFEALLFEDDENNHNFELLNARKSKGMRSPILWLSYIIHLKISSVPDHEIDTAFQSALALCSIDNRCSADLQLLWWNYLKFMMKNVKNQKQFQYLLDSVRHCCLTQTDPIFQKQIICYFCQILSDSDKLNALIQFSNIIPENIYVLMFTISSALQLNRKDLCWLLINSIIFDKKVRHQCPEFWKIAIGLSVERKDHLSTHKLFQIALSLMPYNKVLWETFKIYETSVKHGEHLKQANLICQNQLNICQNIFSN